MNTTVKNIILGNQTVVSLDEVFGTEYNVQNELYKKVLLLFISKMKNEIAYGRIDPIKVDEKVNELMRTISNPASLLNQYILGTKIPEDNLRMEIDTILGVYHKTELDDVEDMFAEDKEKAIGLSDFQLEDYRRFPELLERDIEYGVITHEQARLIKEKFESEMATGLGNSKVMTKSKPAFANKEIELGYIEPILLSAVVSLIGLLYVAYLYLIV